MNESEGDEYATVTKATKTMNKSVSPRLLLQNTFDFGVNCGNDRNISLFNNDAFPNCTFHIGGDVCNKNVYVVEDETRFFYFSKLLKSVTMLNYLRMEVQCVRLEEESQEYF